MSENSFPFFKIEKINIAEKKINDEVIRCGECCWTAGGERPAFCPGTNVI